MSPSTQVTTTRNEEEEEQQQHQRSHPYAHHHKKTTTAADAEFLEQIMGGENKTAVNNATATSATALQDLHQSNLLRLQTDELLQESILHLHDSPNNNNTSASGGGTVKWASFATDYIQYVANIIQEDVSLENVVSHHHDSEVHADDGKQHKTMNKKSKRNKKDHNHDRHDHSVVSVHSHARLVVAGSTGSSSSNSSSSNSALGLTTLAGNAQVLPTLQIHVQIPNDVFSNTKDYLRHRSFHKRNLIAWHVAQHLAQEKYASTVGNVHWKWAHMDQRQVVLLLIPPTAAAAADKGSDKDSNKKNKKKRSKKQQLEVASRNKGPFATSSTMPPKRVRFRVEINFGMQSADWIPPLRLVPNRCNSQSPNNNNNNNILPLSQMYNQALTEDAMGYKVTSAALSLYHSHHHDNVMNDTDMDMDDDDDDRSGHDDNNNKKNRQEVYPHWNAAIVLAKIWLLQRGLLHRHDGYTTTGQHYANLIAIQILYLYRTRRVSPRLGPLQVLAAWFKLLAETNWLGDDDDTHEKEQNLASSSSSSSSSGLIRKAPSEAYRETSHQPPGRGRGRRCVLVLPQHVGQGLQQTVAASDLARLYAQQTKESPLTTDKTDPPTLLELYQNTTWYPLGPVLLDSTMRFNFMGRISPACMRLIQTEARKSLAVLQHDYHPNINDNNNNSLSSQQHVVQPFSYLFMKPARFWQRYDAYLYIPLQDIAFGSSTLWGNNNSNNQKRHINNTTIDPLQRQDYGDYETISRGLVKVLRMALGDRVHDLQLLTTGNGIVGSSKEAAARTNNDSAASTDPTVADSDEIPTFPVRIGARSLTPLNKKRVLQSPTGRATIVLGVTLNSDTCHRIVDRGPPADDVDATKAFLELWGEKKAELRRFKDGAIVHAVVWESTPSAEEQQEEDDDDKEEHCRYIRFQNDDKVQGGIVERAIRHILKLHFLKKTMKKAEPPSIQFSLRSLMSTVDSVVPRGEGIMTFNPLAAHRMVLKAFDSLSDFLRKQSLPSVPIPGTTKMRSRLGIPLAIDAVEPLAPSLRYCELFPPIPHPLLGVTAGKNTKLAGAVLSYPILIQIRFGASSNWPNDLRAIGAAKTAMLVQLVSGIEQLRKSKTGFGDDDLIHAFDGPTVVTPGYADIGFMGYVFRILVRADPELKLLHSLTKPSPEAACLLRTLSRRHVVAAMHHSMVHAVYTSHPSSSVVVRLARRWVASHLLSGLVPFEAVELLVVHVYTDKASPLDPPCTVIAGFLRFLRLLAGHNWSREPLIVDPQGHLNEEDYDAIAADFEILRNSANTTTMMGTKAKTSTTQNGPPMFIVSPCDRQSGDPGRPKELNKNPSGGQRSNNNNAALWMPTFTLETPEWVVLNRAAKLAQRTFIHLRRCLMTDPFGSSSIMTSSSSSSTTHHHHYPSWPPAFHETMESFRAYSAIFRVHPDFLVDNESSSSSTTDMSLLVRRNNEGTWESSYTRSMYQRLQGPKDLRMKKLYKNLSSLAEEQHDDDNNRKGSAPLLPEWRPVDSMVENLRRRLGHAALFFYNDLCPEVIGVLWRPQLLVSKSFSAITSECVRPVVTMATGAKADGTSLVVVHVSDLLREASVYTADIVMDQKVFYPPLSCEKETPEARKTQTELMKSCSTRKRRKPGKADDDDEEEEYSD